jgi:hypothetical protein
VGAKKTHDWVVDQFADLFRTTDKVKTQQVVKNWGHHCGDIELGGYLANTTDPVPLVLDLRDGHLRYPNNLDQSLNDTTADKIRRHRHSYIGLVLISRFID